MIIQWTATLTTVAIVLGVAWRIYYCNTAEYLRIAGLTAEIETQLRRIPKPLSWMQRCFGTNWWDKVCDTLEVCVVVGVFGAIGLVLLFALVVSLLDMPPLPPMAIVIGLLVYIAIKLDTRK